MTELHGSFFDLRRVSWMSGVSASVGNVLHAISYPDSSFSRKVWVEGVGSPEFILGAPKEGILSPKMTLNVEKLIDIFRDVQLYQLDAAERCWCEVRIPLLNLRTGKVEVFDNKRIFAAGMYEITMAAKAAPILYDRPVQIGDDFYCDPGMIVNWILPEKLENYRTLVILSARLIQPAERAGYMAAGVLGMAQKKWGSRVLPWWVYGEVAWKGVMVGRRYARLRRLSKKFELKVVAPDEDIPFDYLDLRGSLARIFDAGVEYVRKYREELEDFLG